MSTRFGYRVLHLRSTMNAVTFLLLAFSSRPTFHRDVAPLLFEKCASCHRPEGAAPFPLLSYRDVRSRARQILEVTESGFMPPWLPEAGFGAFAYERRLTAEERSLLREWVEGGAPEGDATDLPAMPGLSRSWQLGEPDLVVEMSRSYTLPPEGEDIYRNFVIPLPIQSRTFVRALELHPGNPRVVHHARILVDRSRGSRRLDEEDPEPGYDGMLVDAAEFPDGLFLGWSPGKVPLDGDEALVWPVEPSTDLVLQLHMLPSGKPEDIRASVGLYFTDEPPRKRAAVLQLGSRTIDIAPGDASHTVEDSYVLPSDVEAFGIYPHAHFLCREMQAFATLPDGTRTWLLWIKDWNFYWQDEYRYQAPVPLPKGTRITMRYVYDNSARNPRNPFDPPRRVRWGGHSTDEMGDLLLMVLPRDPEEVFALREDFRRNELLQEVAGYEKMLETDADNADTRHELAFGYMELGRAADAIAEWQRVVRARPGFAEAHYNLGGALAGEGRRSEAVSSFEKAIEARADYAEAHNNLGVLLSSEGRLEAAEASYRRAIELRPDYAFAHHNLGSALLARGELDEAAAEYRMTISLRPDEPRALSGLAWILAVHPRESFREPDEAVRLAERAREKLEDALTLDALAAAYASASRYPEAVGVAENALAAALAGRRSELAEEIRVRIDLYRRKKPFRAPER